LRTLIGILCLAQSESETPTSGSNDLLDGIIYGTIVLFILSVITEKFTQLARMYPSRFRIAGIVVCTLVLIPIGAGLSAGWWAPEGYLNGNTKASYVLGIVLLLLSDLFCLIMLIANTDVIQRRFARAFSSLSVLNNVRKSDAGDLIVEDKTTVEREVTILSFIIGFIVAYSFNAHLFGLLDTKPHLGWGDGKPLFVETVKFPLPNPELFSFDAMKAVGFVLTAFFLAFGSKFFHDLLDTLLQVKEYKRKMNDRETYQVSNIKQFDEYFYTDYLQLAKICLEQNKATVAALPNLGAYFVGVSSDPLNRRPVIILHSTLQNNAGYPPSFQGRLDSGKIYNVKTEVVYGFTEPEIHLDPGDSISHKDFSHTPGTICCCVKDNQRTYLLTCAHVMTGGAPVVTVTTTNGWVNLKTPDDTKSADTKFAPIGTLAFALIDNELDAALSETTEVIRPVVNINVPPADYTDALNGAEVRIEGKLNKTQAFVQGYSQEPIKFRYSGGSHKLGGLILISNNNIGTPVTATQKGDSGAMVYLVKDRVALGMVIGGNSQYTYVIPLSRILLRTKTQLT
jgi:hypothetical protein